MSSPSAKHPPHNIEAEAGLLGALLIDNAALTRIRGKVTEDDFYTHEHQTIFNAICRLIDSGKSADFITVSNWLDDRGRGHESGGMSYLGTLAADATGSKSIEGYAETVREKAMQRGLIATGQDIAEFGYSPDGRGSEELIAQAEELIYKLRNKTPARSLAMHEVIEVGITAIEKTRADKAAGGKGGLPFGISWLDKRIGGLQGGDVVVVGARPGMGKAHPLTTNVLTPDGWVQIGDLQPGDLVMGADGRPTQVLAIHDRGELDVYRLTVDDGRSVLCCDDHLWLTKTRDERRYNLGESVKTLREIRQTLKINADNRTNHSIRYCSPMEFSTKTLPIDPYVLGCFLGDGNLANSAKITKSESEMVEEIRKRLPDGDSLMEQGRRGNDFRVKFDGPGRSQTYLAMEQLGLDGKKAADKFIPEYYLMGDIEQRCEMMRGLLDTDGYVDPNGGTSIEYVTVSPHLRDGMAFIAGSLGARVHWSTKHPTFTYRGEVREGQTAYRIHISFNNEIKPFKLSRKADAYSAVSRPLERYVVSVEAEGRAQCRCITVAASDSLYVTEGFLVTHNSSFANQFCINSARAGHPGFVASLEMYARQLAVRSLAHIAKVNNTKLKFGADAEFETALNHVAEAGALPLWFDFDTYSLSGIVGQITHHVLKHGAQYAVVDHIGLIEVDGSSRMSNTDKVEIASRTLKITAKKLNIPLIVLAQLNRNVERENRPPQLSDLRACGAIEQDASIVIFLHSDTKDGTNPKEISFVMPKNRDGRVGASGNSHVFDGATQTFSSTAPEPQEQEQKTGSMFAPDPLSPPP